MIYCTIATPVSLKNVRLESSLIFNKKRYRFIEVASLNGNYQPLSSLRIVKSCVSARLSLHLRNHSFKMSTKVTLFILCFSFCQSVQLLPLDSIDCFQPLEYKTAAEPPPPVISAGKQTRKKKVDESSNSCSTAFSSQMHI